MARPARYVLFRPWANVVIAPVAVLPTKILMMSVRKYDMRWKGAVTWMERDPFFYMNNLAHCAPSLLKRNVTHSRFAIPRTGDAKLTDNFRSTCDSSIYC